MLRVVEEAARSDAGRERFANEDAYFARSPLYAVADGMGGAQAGEIASRLAADAFDVQFSDEGNAEERLADIAAEANRRIFDLARSDSSRSGMGTTLTGILVSDSEVSIVHVGDSRAYLFRDGELRQLTRDHSLVEELRRRGQLTPEEAEEHPQRSIITRALGPEPEVEPDVHTHQVRHGDVFLLCSDGLTSMVREDRVREILAIGPTLRKAVDQLVDEANHMGGRDNITVVMFRVAVEEGAPRDELEDTVTGLDGEAVRAASVAGRDREEKPQQTDTAVDRPTRDPGRKVTPEAAHRSRREAQPATTSAEGRRRVSGRRVAVGAAALLVGAALVVGAVAGLRSVYFIGQDRRGLVAVYRGLPYELPAGIKLYEERYVSPVPVRSLRPFERRRLLDHELRSRGSVAEVVRELEGGG